MEIIRSHNIEEGLTVSGRVYLCGNLQKENAVKHIVTDGYEMGITDYPIFKFEKAHMHTFNTEYNFVLKGQIKLFLLNEKKEILLSEGDLFVINVNEPYVCKAAAGSRTFFTKIPGGNDKLVIPEDKKLIHWGSTWDATYEEE